MNIEEIILKYAKRVKNKELTWREATQEYNKETGLQTNSEALRKRAYKELEDEGKINKRPSKINTDFKPEKLEFEDGFMNAEKIVELTPVEKMDKDKVKEKIVTDPENWEVVSYSISEWLQHTKEQTTKKLYAVKIKLKPAKIEIKPIDLVLETKKIFEQEIRGSKYTPKAIPKGFNDDRLTVINIADAHFGRLSWNGETGCDYDQEIATNRFKYVIERTIDRQRSEKTGHALVIIGNDLFNSDNPNDTTTKGTQQYNDVRWKKMYGIVLKVWIEALTDLEKEFPHIRVQLCPGNHDMVMSFTLFLALGLYFKDSKVIEFSENIQKTQAYVFGKNLIITDHCEMNQKRFLESITKVFAKEWGQTEYRTALVNHIHEEHFIDNKNGITLRRMPSFANSSEWEFDEKYINQTPKHLNLIFDRNDGEVFDEYITFEVGKKDKIMKKLRDKK